MSTAESTAPRRHAYTDPGAPQFPEPTHAERVRTLASLSIIATLSTVSRKLCVAKIRSEWEMGLILEH
jgi:heme iron utilization protein